ncbi:COPII coat GTPase [Neocucurbitaria cava]|uniref:COPII coat GTPase n=1 Tax=Neocucurbitaria cava TaxID=798079 RepID=A0A9W9CIX1_9PLEO|nr:COPII coat GTPase [Neocucurbitaria cava]
MVVLDLCRRMVRKLSYEFTVLYTFWTVIACTYIAATIAIFVECRPCNRYWQLSPDPGECVKGNAWLLTYEVGNIITDSMLLALPLPPLFHAKTTLSKRLRLLSLFSLGFFLIAVSIVRMVQGNKNARIQLSRTMWASIETLFASVVAMGPAIHGLGGGTVESRAWTELRNLGRQDAEDASTKGILAVTTVTHMQESDLGFSKG